VLALLADDDSQPAACADAVAAALAQHPAFEQLLEALTDSRDGPCAKDAAEAARLERESAEALQRRSYGEAAELSWAGLLKQPGGGGGRLQALRDEALAALAARHGERAEPPQQQFLPPEQLFACCERDAIVPAASPRVVEAQAPGAGRGLFLLQGETQASPGCVLLCERPFVLAVHKPQRATRCHACLARLASAAVPCRGCAGARFCSPACEAAAAAGTHGTLECGGAAWPFALPTEALLTLRLAARLASDPGQDAERVRRLTAHWAGGAMPPPERAERCVLSAVLARCAPLPPSQLLQAGLILRSNCFAVLDEWAPAAWAGGAREELRAGCALYASASLLNHSCAPNCHASFAAGGALVLRLTAPPAPANAAGPVQLLISYGPQAGQAGRAERRRLLRASHAFLCACDACCAGEAAEAAPPGLRAAMEALRSAAASSRGLGTARDAFARVQALAPGGSRAAASAWDCLAQALHEAGPECAAEAAAASEASLLGLRALYPAGALPLGYELGKLAELRAAAGQGEGAAEVAAEAAAILAAAYGPSHPRLAELAAICPGAD